jgi:hypothetical protein
MLHLDIKATQSDYFLVSNKTNLAACLADVNLLRSTELRQANRSLCSRQKHSEVRDSNLGSETGYAD